MGINLVTGYDIQKDELGECRNTISPYSLPTYQKVKSNNDLFDENETTFLYNQKPLREDYEHNQE